MFFTAIVALSVPVSALAFPYEFRESIATPGSGDGQLDLGAPSGVAVNLATGDFYVADSGNHRVVVFDSNGAFIRAFGADVGGAGVNVCTSGCVAGTLGSTPGAFENPTFLAIDNNPLSPSFGDVYVADNGASLVSKFEADGTLITSWGANGQLDGSTAANGPFDDLNGNPVEIAGIAVDASGNLFVKQTGANGFMFKFDQAGMIVDEFTTTFKTNPLNALPRGIAVDSTGNLYMVRGTGVVAKLDSTGEPLVEEIDCGFFLCAQAITVDPSNDDLYIAEEDKVERYNSASRPTGNLRLTD